MYTIFQVGLLHPISNATCLVIGWGMAGLPRHESVLVMWWWDWKIFSFCTRPWCEMPFIIYTAVVQLIRSTIFSVSWRRLQGLKPYPRILPREFRVPCGVFSASGFTFTPSSQWWPEWSSSFPLLLGQTFQFTIMTTNTGRPRTTSARTMATHLHFWMLMFTVSSGNSVTVNFHIICHPAKVVSTICKWTPSCLLFILM